MRAASISATAVTPSPVHATGTPTDHSRVDAEAAHDASLLPEAQDVGVAVERDAHRAAPASTSRLRNRWTRMDRSRSGRAAGVGVEAVGQRPGRPIGRSFGARHRARHAIGSTVTRSMPRRRRGRGLEHDVVVARDRAAEQAEPGAPQRARGRGTGDRARHTGGIAVHRSRRSDIGDPRDRGCSPA